MCCIAKLVFGVHLQKKVFVNLNMNPNPLTSYRKSLRRQQFFWAATGITIIVAIIYLLLP